MVELKARFDEEHNIVWARALEQSGVHVVYGLVGLKTHCKVCSSSGASRDGIRRYVHLATGNYNPTTARIYTDLALLHGASRTSARTPRALQPAHRLLAPRHGTSSSSRPWACTRRCSG